MRFARFFAATLALSVSHAPAIPITFDVDNVSIGQGFFTMDLPDSWSGINWGGFMDRQWFSAESETGGIVMHSVSNGDIYVPWRTLQVGFFNARYGITGPPEETTAMFFVFTDKVETNPLFTWGGYSLMTYTANPPGNTPVQAILNIPGVSLRQSAEDVPDGGGTLALLSLVFAGMVAAGKRKRKHLTERWSSQ